MFGHVFQPYGQIPRSYRRVAWLKSDGNAYINLEYQPFGSPSPQEEVPIFENINGTHVTICASYPSQSLIQPGCAVGMSTHFIDPITEETIHFQFGMWTRFAMSNKIADNGTITFEEYIYPIGYQTVTAEYSRNEFGEYSGTMTMMGETENIPSDGGIVAPHCPAQQQSETTTYKRFALLFHKNASNAGYTDGYAGIASQTFYSSSMQGIKFTCSTDVYDATHGFREIVPLSIGTATHMIPKETGATGSLNIVDSTTLFMFARNNKGVASDFDGNVKISGCTIVDAPAADVLSFYTRRNLIAVVRNRDDKPGFYDTVSKRFFTNAASSGEFTFAELTT